VIPPQAITSCPSGSRRKATGTVALGVGVCDRFDLFADGGWTVVVLSNYKPPVGERLADRILEPLAAQ
jgi:hypothetical protein